MKSNLTDDVIKQAFFNTNFGRTDYRKMLEQAVLKKLVGYNCGHTISVIMRELGLVGYTFKPTKRGREFVAHAYNDILKESP